MRVTHLKHSFRGIGFLFLLLTGVSYAADMSQWRGPNRDGHYPETGLLRQWTEQGPSLKWSAEGLGDGWGSASVSPTGIFLVGSIDKQDHLIKLDAQGNVLWKKAYGPAWVKSWPGARCTPTVVAGRVYVTSGQGHVVCLDAQSGDTIWSLDGLKTFGGEQVAWGTVESLLLTDGKVFFTPGGTSTAMVALDMTTGQVVWQSESLNDRVSYASPILVESGNKKGVINITREYIFCVDVSSGQILWRYQYSQLPHSDRHKGLYINCISPIYRHGHLFVTSGYDHTAVMLKVLPNHSGVEEVWQQREFDTHHGGVVWLGDYLYGSNWLSNAKGNWLCVDGRTGEIKYNKAWETKGSIIYADGRLYCYEQKDGHVALVRPTPQDFNVVSSFQITLGDKQHWAHPVIHDGTLYIRHGNVLMAYDISDA